MWRLTIVVTLTEELQEPKQIFSELIILKNLGTFMDRKNEKLFVIALEWR